VCLVDGQGFCGAQIKMGAAVRHGIQEPSGSETPIAVETVMGSEWSTNGVERFKVV